MLSIREFRRRLAMAMTWAAAVLAALIAAMPQDASAQVAALPAENPAMSAASSAKTPADCAAIRDNDARLASSSITCQPRARRLCRAQAPFPPTLRCRVERGDADGS